MIGPIIGALVEEIVKLVLEEDEPGKNPSKPREGKPKDGSRIRCSGSN